MHDQVEMTFIERCPKKSRPTATYKRGKNIWFNVYRCPSCGDVLRRLANVKFKGPAVCNGKNHATQNAHRRA